MAVTTNYALPYPVDSDPVDVAGDLQSLAVATDSAIQTGASNAGGFKKSFLLMGG